MRESLSLNFFNFFAFAACLFSLPAIAAESRAQTSVFRIEGAEYSFAMKKGKSEAWESRLRFKGENSRFSGKGEDSLYKEVFEKVEKELRAQKNALSFAAQKNCEKDSIRRAWLRRQRYSGRFYFCLSNSNDRALMRSLRQSVREIVGDKLTAIPAGYDMPKPQSSRVQKFRSSGTKPGQSRRTKKSPVSQKSKLR